MTMPALNFFFYLAILAGVYVFRLAYIGWFGPYLVTAVAVLPPLLLLMSLPSMYALDVGLSVPEHCTRGSGTQLRLSFNTRGVLPLSKIKVKLEIENRFTGESQQPSYKFRSVLSCDSFLPLPTDDCGVLICRIVSYESYDLLGLFRVRRKSGAAAKCAVLPQAVKPEIVPDIDAAMNAALRLKPKYGGGFSEEHDLRSYQPGDTVNSIHWKLSSKTDEVIVREPLICENNEVYVVLTQVGMGDRGLEVLYWLSLELCKREIPHIIVSAHPYPAENEDLTQEALAGILSAPMAPPCSFDRSLARCVFIISGEEVKVT